MALNVKPRTETRSDRSASGESGLIMSVQAGVTRIKSTSQLLRLLVLGSVAHYLALGGYEARSLATAGRKWN